MGRPRGRRVLAVIAAAVALYLITRSGGSGESDLPLEALWAAGGEGNQPDFDDDPRLLQRARALSHILPRLGRVGSRWTTIFRSEAFTDRIYARKYKRQNGVDWPGPGRPPRPYLGPSMHERFLAADDGVSPGPDSPQALKQREEELLAQPEANFIRSVLHEGDHLHLRFHADLLESLGAFLLENDGRSNV